MTDHEKDFVASIVRNKYGDYEVFPLKVVEALHGFWVNADIWVDADELVRSERQTVQDAGSSLQGNEGENDMKKYAVTVTLIVEAKSEKQAENRAFEVVNFGGCNDAWMIGWDLEEIEEMP